MFRFENPDYLRFLTAVPVMAALLWGWWRWRTRAFAVLGTPNALNRLIPHFSVRRFWVQQTLLLIAIALLITAWANPQIAAGKQTVSRESSDVLLILDISNSMLAEDIKPSRMELSRQFAQKLIKKLEGERMGLIFFAGNAFLQVPLSTDYGFMMQSLQTASPDLVTSQGTAIAEAIKLAETSFDDENGAGRAIVLITDGENHDTDAVDAVKSAFNKGIVTFPVGAGTPEGGFIPTNTTGESRYKRDEQGDIVRTRLNEELLRDLAGAGGAGAVLNIRESDHAVATLSKEIAGLAKRQLEVPAASDLQTQYQWFLLPAIILLLLSIWFKYTVN